MNWKSRLSMVVVLVVAGVLLSSVLFWDRSEAGEVEPAAKTETVSAAAVATVAPEHLLDHMYARQYGNWQPAGSSSEAVEPASSMVEAPAEGRLDYMYAQQYGNWSPAESGGEIVGPPSPAVEMPVEGRLDYMYAQRYGNWSPASQSVAEHSHGDQLDIR